MQPHSWVVHVSAAAEADFRDILAWTAEHFGAAQARVYAATLSSAMEALADGPKTIGIKARDEILPGLFTLHVAREGRRGRHFVIFRTRNEQEHQVVEILRLLHDATDLPRHLQAPDQGAGR